jgi:hypothetical protein
VFKKLHANLAFQAILLEHRTDKVVFLKRKKQREKENKIPVI